MGLPADTARVHALARALSLIVGQLDAAGMIDGASIVRALRAAPTGDVELDRFQGVLAELFEDMMKQLADPAPRLRAVD